MAKRGRPRLPKNLVARRTATFLLPEEKVALAKAARAEERTVSNLIKWCALGDLNLRPTIE